jgi:K+/H+ antiporter YhaU regulatory subunit KhtT
MKTKPQVPSDIFSVGDIITVVGSSKHHGRLATVQKAGSRRLTICFHDKNKGTYVDFENTRILDTTTSKTEEANGLASIMEQLAITTATTTINSGEESQRKALLNKFLLSLQGHIDAANHEGDRH